MKFDVKEIEKMERPVGMQKIFEPKPLVFCQVSHSTFPQTLFQSTTKRKRPSDGNCL